MKQIIKKLLPLIVFTFFAGISILIWLKDFEHQKRLIREHTEGLAHQVAFRLEDAFEQRLKILQTLASERLGWSGWVEKYFTYHSSIIMASFTGFQAINWIDSEGIIRRVYPEEPNRAALNKDLRQHPETRVRDTFNQAEKTRVYAITPVVELYQGGQGVASYWPVITKKGALAGYLNGVFKIKPLIEACLPHDVEGPLHFILLEEGRIIYYSDESMNSSTSVKLLQGNDEYVFIELEFFERKWTLCMAPVENFLSGAESTLKDLILVFGLILSAGLALFIHLLYRKMEQLFHAKQRAENAVTRCQISEQTTLEEKRFNDNIIAAIPTAILVLDKELNILKANRSFFELFPSTTPEIVGKPYCSVLCCNEEAENRNECLILKALEKVFAQSEPTFNQIVELETGKNRKNWFKFSAVGVKRKNSEALLILDNISAIKELEEDSEQRRKYMEAIFRSVPDAIITLDSNHSVVEWNPGAEKLFGYARKEAVGINIDELVVCPDKLEESRAFTKSVLNGGDIHPIETVRCCKNGRRVEVIVAGSPIRSDDKAAGVVAVYKDISERKRAEAAIIKAKQEWERTFDAVPDLIAILDNQHQILRANRAMAERLNTTPQELVGKKCYELVHKSHTPPPGCKMEKMLREGKSYDYEFHEDQLDGDFYATVTPLVNQDGEIEGCVHVLYDVTRRKQAEIELHKSQERYKTLIVNQGEGIGVADLDERFTFVNPAMEELLGRPEKELLAHSLSEFMDEEHFKTILQQTKIRKRGIKSGYDIVITRSDGEKRIVHITASPLWAENGEYSGSFAVFRDITNQKRAEEARDRSFREAEELRNLIVKLNTTYTMEDMLPLILNSAFSMTGLEKGGIFIIDEDGKNAQLKNYKGITEKQAASLEQIPLESLQENLLNEFVSFVIPNKADPSFIHQIGIEHEIKHIYIAPLRFKESLVGFITLSTSTEKKLDAGGISLLKTLGAETAAILWRLQTEQALKTSESFNRGIVTHSPVGILYLNAEGKIIYENPAIYRMLGLPEVRSSSYIGKHFQDVPLFRNVNGGDIFARVVAGEVVEGAEVEYRSHSGQTRFLEIFASPRWGVEGKVIGAVVMCLDLTNYRTLEMQLRQAQKMEAVGTLAGGIAHDFNNLLTGIMGNVELLQRKLQSKDPMREDLERVQKSAERAAELTAQLLAFGRRRMEQPKPANINDCIDETFELFSRTIDPRIEIVSQKESQLWVVKADTGQLNQVLMNLLVNARDAMPNGGKITMKSENYYVSEEMARDYQDVKSGEYVRIAIADTGAGIESDHMERIFEPFFSTKTHGKGTGLGLAMVYSIVKAHLGWIAVSSEPDIGTTFEIYLPRAREELIPEEPITTDEIKGGKETILLADDEEIVRNLGKSVLEEFGYKVVLATDGVNAIEIYRRGKKRIELVILDLSMPRKSGRETLKDLLKLNPDLPVIISSGFDKGGPVEELLESGAKGFVQKPYRMEQMLQTVRRVLDSRNKGKNESE